MMIRKTPYPGAIEVCDSRDTDEDCDGVADDDDTSALASTKRVFYPDNDKDGYGSVAATGALYCDNPTTAAASFTLDQSDCNDANSAINPSATEVCDAGNIDEDCNGLADDNDPYTVATDKQRFYADRDWDGYGDEADVGLLRCDSPSSGSMVYVTDNSDCDNASSRVNPGQVEQCDPSDVDEDCNGVADDDDTVSHPRARHRTMWISTKMVLGMPRLLRFGFATTHPPVLFGTPWMIQTAMIRMPL